MRASSSTNGSISSGPSEQFKPRMSGCACASDMSNASTVCPLKFRPDLSITVPLMISGTVIDKSGRNLSGQTVEALLISLAHAQPLILGLNCSLGPDEMEPFVEELARISPYYMSAYPNAGLPDALSPTGFP